MLASKFIDYSKVDVSKEIVDYTKASNEIVERHLKKLGMRYVDHDWIMVGEPAAGNVEEMEEDDETKAQHEPTP